MRIIVNGRPETVEDGRTIADFLAAHSLAPDTVVVELNESIVQADDYALTCLHDNDRLEIVRFVGGG